MGSFLLSIGSKELFGQFYKYSKNFRLWNDKVLDIFLLLFIHKKESYICLLERWKLLLALLLFSVNVLMWLCGLLTHLEF